LQIGDRVQDPDGPVEGHRAAVAVGQPAGGVQDPEEGDVLAPDEARGGGRQGGGGGQRGHKSRDVESPTVAETDSQPVRLRPRYVTNLKNVNLAAAF
jgi:hypothetical protein